jgi:hypothetical protein
VISRLITPPCASISAGIFLFMGETGIRAAENKDQAEMPESRLIGGRSGSGMAFENCSMFSPLIDHD